MSTPIEILLAVADIGGRLGITGQHLRMLLPPDCPPELKASIRAHKPALLELLRLNFLIVQSGTVNARLFWTPDTATKQALAAAGASAGSIYTAGELEHLNSHRVTVAELPLIHAVKQRFNGTVGEPRQRERGAR